MKTIPSRPLVPRRSAVALRLVFSSVQSTSTSYVNFFSGADTTNPPQLVITHH